MASIFKNTKIDDTGFLKPSKGNINQRPRIKTVTKAYTTVDSTTWTAPPNVTQIEALVVAGGGGGGAMPNDSNRGSGGGGAGGLLYKQSLPVTPGTTYDVVVGAGGSGNTEGNNGGTNGGHSLFGNLGSNIITNGTFETGNSGWSATNATLDGGPSAGNTLQITPDASVNGAAYQVVTTVPNKRYLLTFDITQDAAFFARIKIGSSDITDSYRKQSILAEETLGVGSHSFIFTAQDTSTYINFEVGGGTQQVTNFDNVVCRPIDDALYAIGGGKGGNRTGGNGHENGKNGGSGGGTDFNNSTEVYSNPTSSKAGNGTIGQGNPGGHGWAGAGAGGGGGAGEPGGVAPDFPGGSGGNGLYFQQFEDWGSPAGWFAGGGAGGSGESHDTGGRGGRGGGGAGGIFTTAPSGQDGVNGTGGGGGGATTSRATGTANGGNGGSGIVIIRYSYLDDGLTGNDLITNGTFDTDTSNWTAYTANGSTTTFSVVNNTLQVVRSGGTGNGEPYQAITVTPGTIYELNLDVSLTKMSVVVETSLGAGAGNDRLVARNFDVGKGSARFVSESSTVYVRFIPDNNGTTSGVDNVSVKEVVSSNDIGLLRYNTDTNEIEIYEGPGKGWTIEDSQKNFAGHNLLTHSEDLNTGATATQGMTLSDTTLVGPDLESIQGVVATPSTSNETKNLGMPVYSHNGPQVATIWAKASGAYKYVQAILSRSTEGSDGYVTFDLSDGSIGSTNLWTGETEYLGHGWYKLIVYINPDADWTQDSASATIRWFVVEDKQEATRGGPAWTADGSSDILFTKATYESSKTPGTYTRTDGARAFKPYRYNGFVVHEYTDASTSSFAPANDGEVEVLVVAGGGGGGSCANGDAAGGGGGAGGLIYRENYSVKGGLSYEVVVGAGGTGSTDTNGTTVGSNGNNSSFGPLIAIGGGAGGSTRNGQNARPGGSGGGAGSDVGGDYGGAGVSGQGNKGGFCNSGQSGAGGGGAGAPGSDGWALESRGHGGHGLYFSQFESWGSPPGWFAGGGGSGRWNAGESLAGLGGYGGGAQGGLGTDGTNGVNGTGGGGGGGGMISGVAGKIGGNGGSGIVLIRYKQS